MPILTGLSDAEAAARLQSCGPNELPSSPRRVFWHIVTEVLREPMFLLLLGAGALYLVLGDRTDALMLLAFVFVSVAITVAQERKTERALASLRDLSSPRALVIRHGEQHRIAGRDVVPGDLLVLSEGDRVAADGIVLECRDLLVDESMLTGESVPVAKSGGPPGAAPGAPAADAAAARLVYAGSLIVQGSGLAQVQATGVKTQLGTIGKRLQELAPSRSPLQQEVTLLVKRFALVGATLSALLLLLYGWRHGDWLGGLLVAISLAMSMLPEEFTVIFTGFMALGAWRIAKHQVLTRNTPVIEALGSATVLCVDKTGTLTQNRMAVSALVLGARRVDIPARAGAPLPADVGQVLGVAVLASQAMPFDPMEQAIHRSLADHFPANKAGLADWHWQHGYPLSKDLMAVTHIWRSAAGGHVMAATKGAPEAVIGLCRLDAGQRALILQQVQQLAEQGMRVLAVAQSTPPPPPWPATPAALAFEWLGLLALADPLRPEVPGAIEKCRRAGIRVIMITGDYPATAQAIARQAGLPYQQVFTGDQLAATSDADLSDAVNACHVYARILPEQKLRLVTALKANGEVVAMTGDGVNDAPALKAAHIGISMGARGSDVAREASSLVLLNDDFNSIVTAIELGRRIYDNLRKALRYVVAVHVPIAGLVMLPVLLGMAPVLAPIHIVFLEMIINPACAVVFEAENAERDCMQRRPRSTAERLFGAGDVGLALLQGLGLLATATAVLFFAPHVGADAGATRALVFACVVLGNLALIVSSRSATRHLLALLRIPNLAQWFLLAAVTCALALALSVPGLQQVFHFAALPPGTLVYSILASLLAAAWCELLKAGFARYRPRR